MKGICKLCGKNDDLRESHFIPKFVGKWIKKTSVTGYIREKNEVQKRAQDIAKEHWLCGDCILGMKDIVIGAFLDYQETAEQEKEELLKEVKKYGWSVDETGKLRKL